jgi:hypothetical protein
MATLTVDKPKEAITALLQERQRYEQWLAGLETRRASTPTHVYARVRADYEGRLSRVIDELGGRTAELRQVVDALSSQVASLQDEESAKRDLQTEAELRAAVGEYTAEQWHEVSQTSQVELARLAALKADASSELAQVQQLLNMASVRRPAAPPPAAAPAAVAGPSAPVPGVHPQAPAVPRAPRPGEPVTGSRAMARPGEPVTGSRSMARAGEPPTGGRTAPRPETFDELAFLHSVVEPKPAASVGGAPRAPGEPSTRPTVLPPSAATAPAPAAPRPVAPPPDVQPVIAAPAKPVPPPPPPRPTVTPPDAAILNTTLPPTTSKPEPARRGVMDSESVPVFLRDVPSEQVKTLKCAECGTMNYPTEWYCERCGGELAAM